MSIPTHHDFSNARAGGQTKTYAYFRTRAQAEAFASYIVGLEFCDLETVHFMSAHGREAHYARFVCRSDVDRIRLRLLAEGFRAGLAAMKATGLVG